MKIINLIPGDKILEFKEIQEKIFLKMYSEEMDNSDDSRSWKLLNEKVYTLKQLRVNKSFYVMYIHPVHAYMNRLFDTNKDDLLEFMHKYINCDKGDGIDIIIATKDYSMILICNHDGEIYQAK